MSPKESLTERSCRICFEKCSNWATEASTIAEVFYKLVGYRILPCDTPQKVCNQCLKTISILQRFKEICDNAEKVLSELRDDTIEMNEEYLEEEIKFELETVQEQPPPKKRKKGLNTTMLSWNYFGLETYLQQQQLQPSESHSFILKFELTRPKPGQLPPCEDLETYEATTSDLTTLSCTYCSYRGIGPDAKEEVIDHCKIMCAGRNMFRCPCSFETCCLDILRHHIRSKHDPKKRVLLDPLQCNFCRFTCCYEMTMERHWEKMHQGEQQEVEKCGECGESFYCDDLKLQHIVFRCHCGESDAQIPFKAIFGKEIRPFNFNKPDIKALPRNTRVLCDFCGAEVTKRTLQTHITKFHHKVRFECDLCGRSYNDKTNLVKHIKGKHLGITNYPCQYCDKVFKHWSSRYIHIKAIHMQDYKHACDMCDKRYIKASALKHHKATHSDLRTISCPQCDGTFQNITQLAQHRKRVHSTSQFDCSTCGKMFKSKQLLRQHKLSHQPNKFFCPVCPVSYSVGISLRAHVASKHPTYEMPPPGTTLRNVNINKLKLQS